MNYSCSPFSTRTRRLRLLKVTHNLPPLKYDNSLSHRDSFGAVRHDNSRQLNSFDGRIDELLVPDVEMTGCLVKAKHFWIFVQGARQQNSLLLAARKTASN